MAPILATPTGVTPQVLADDELRDLYVALTSISLPVVDGSDHYGSGLKPEMNVEDAHLEIEKLCTIIQDWSDEWHSDEQVDSHDWIPVLNILDSAMSWIMKKHGNNLLLLGSVERTKNEARFDEKFTPATTYIEIVDCPGIIIQQVKIILNFSAVLLRNSVCKSLYASVPIIADLLGAADDAISDSALRVLNALSLPPSIHKQQALEKIDHTTALHQSGKGSDIHHRLTCLARAWGTKSMGLGLYTVVTVDDSIHGQGSLPAAFGQLNFSYYNHRTNPDSINGNIFSMEENDENSLIREVTLSLQEMLLESGEVSSSADGSPSIPVDADQEASNKRRRLVSSTLKRETKSTSELFFLALEKAGGRENIPPDRLFSLLSEIRIARAFHSQSSRIQAVQRRLYALITILHVHPSHEVMNGYFQAFPDLIVEIVDLLRSTVSPANAAAMSDQYSPGSALRPDSITNLVSGSTQNIPYNVRMLALEALTALFSRRDSHLGSLSGSARLSYILTELGVGKGQYLGLLPTLIRYSLNALHMAPVTSTFTSDEFEKPSDSSETFDVGMAFTEATMAPVMDREVEVEKALLLIDNVLTLTSAVVRTSSGTTALADCGLIPALLGTVSMDLDDCLSRLLNGKEPSRRMKALLRFVTAQAIQILECSVGAHPTSMTMFNDLQGFEILTVRLWKDISSYRQKDIASEKDEDIEMKDDDLETKDVNTKNSTILVSSERVLLFSMVTCLSVVFQQESTSSTTVTTGGSRLRNKELTDSLIAMMNAVQTYGGHIASHFATLLSDAMNHDPHVVHYVHQSGIASSFLNMIIGKQKDGSKFEPTLPPVQDLISNVPSVVLALSLTEDGAKEVVEKNPFPSFLRLFYHPEYAMPRSRCLIGVMSNPIAMGLCEIMRHDDRFKPAILSALTVAVKDIVTLSDDLSTREEHFFSCNPFDEKQRILLEDERSCMIQYVLNFGLLLEQIFQNEQGCIPFTEEGGLDSLLQLFPSSMPSDNQFLAYLSSLSSPSVSTLHHSTIEDTLSGTLKYIDSRFDSAKWLNKVIEATSGHLDKVERCQKEILCHGNSQFILDNFPRRPAYQLSGSTVVNAVAKYLKYVTQLQWITAILSNALKALCEQSNEAGRVDEWKKDLYSKKFEDLVNRLSAFYRTSLFEVCRARSQSDFEEYESLQKKNQSQRLLYRLRIVCSEGSIVRDGIEIDSCKEIGSMEMGDIVDSFDRCINSSGILRYRTNRGWISEMTRGHKREPIAEVISIRENREDETLNYAEERKNTKRVEAPISCLFLVGIGVLARGQACYSDLFRSISRLSIQNVRNLSSRTISFDEGSQGAHISLLMKLLAENLRFGFCFDYPSIHQNFTNVHDEKIISRAGMAMYFGCSLSHVHLCLMDDGRESRLVNFPLLVSLLAADPFVKNLSEGVIDLRSRNDSGLFNSIRFVLQFGLDDFVFRSVSRPTIISKAPPQRVGRCIAASYPPVLNLLRKLISTPFWSSPSALVMTRVKLKDVSLLLGFDESSLVRGEESEESFLSPEIFVGELHIALSKVVKESWTDPGIVHVPPFLLYPFVNLVDDIMGSLKDASKKKSAISTSSFQSFLRAESPRLTTIARTRREDSLAAMANEEVFEASEEAILQLIEMGFSRDHALDALESTRSNRVETAMDYALSNPPPSAATVERRRIEREERSRRRQEQQEESAVSSNIASVLPNANSNNDNNDDMLIEVNNVFQDFESPNEANKKAESKQNEEGSRNHKTLAQSELLSWQSSVPEVSCHFLASMPSHFIDKLDTAEYSGVKVDMNGDNEATTVILSSFLLDLCQKCPEEQVSIVSRLLGHLKTKLTKKMDDDTEEYLVLEEDEVSVASLCHAVVLIIRAVPSTRLLVLKEGLTKSLLSCMKRSLLSEPVEVNNPVKEKSFPMWLSPVLLLLANLAQPLVAFADESNVKSLLEGNPDTELVEVHTEHTDQTRKLYKLASICSSAIPKDGDATELMSSAFPEGQDNFPEDGMNIDSVDLDVKKEGSFMLPTVPAYFPLLSNESTLMCLNMCKHLLTAKPIASSRAVLPPGITHSALLLLFRLLRTPNISTKCLEMGIVMDILSLSKDSKFDGSTPLVTLIFRRLLEDEQTLQLAMEAEICAIFDKLLDKINDANATETTVPLSSFIESATPLLCRNPTVFLKSMALSVLIERRDEKKGVVFRLSPSGRSKRLEALTNLTQQSLPKCDDSKDEPSHHRKSTPGSKTKSKIQNKSSKKKKRDKSDACKETLPTFSESPAVQLTHLIVNSILNLSTRDSTNMFPESFLWAANLLDILANLIITIPACGTAVHYYRKGKKGAPALHVLHTLSGSPAPPRTFITFLLHALLPQDRWTISNDSRLWVAKKDESPQDEPLIQQKKKSSHQTLKLSQATARVLVALAVRPGEGRKRVIADLTFALSCGCLGHGAVPLNEINSMKSTGYVNLEMDALNAWSELCIALMAPRSNGKNLDGMSALSVDNIRTMLDFGLVHALLVALHRVKLKHPMAAKTSSSLLVPLEVLTRPTVTDAVRDLLLKENPSKGNAIIAPNETASTQKNRGDAQADRSFDHDMANPDVQDTENQVVVDQEGNDQFVPSIVHQDSAEPSHELFQEFVNPSDYEVLPVSHITHLSAVDSLDGLRDADDDDDDDNDEEEEDDDDDDDDEEEGASEEDGESQSEQSDEQSEDEESEVEDMNEEEDHSDMEDSEDGSSDEIEEEENGWNVDFHDNFGSQENTDVHDLVEVEGSEGNDHGDGWTRIEPTGFGRMFLGERRRGLIAGIGADHRGFMDVAEMISNMLRNGDIRGENLAEIEGIRIMSGGRSLRATLGTGELQIGLNDFTLNRLLGTEGGRQADRNRVGDNLRSIPQIHQRDQPEVGYSAFGRDHCVEINSMEYVFGGPSVSGGSSNYELNSPFRETTEAEAHVSLCHLDLQLFPHGPLIAANPRTQLSTHPMLSGVDLPPMNSLVSDYLPQGSRLAGRGQTATRRSGEYNSSFIGREGFMVSPIGTHTILPGRSHSSIQQGSFSARSHIGPVSMTDDGLPVDAAFEDFSSAFVQRMLEAAAPTPTTATEDVNANNMESVSERNNDVSNAPEGGNEHEPVDATMDLATLVPLTQVAQSEEHESFGSDGDRAVTSMAAELCLSPGVEGVSSRVDDVHAISVQNALDQIDSLISPPIPSDNTLQDSAVVDTDVFQGNPVIGEHNADPSNLMNIDSHVDDESDNMNVVGISSEANVSHGNSANSNGLVCPPDVDQEVFDSLPREMQQDCVDEYQATQELATQLDGSSLDPSVLAELPPDVRREVIEQDRRMREQMQAQADPGRAEDIDIASFIATLSSPELRQDILLTAEESVLRSLPPDIQAEAQILRERASSQNRRFYESGMVAANDQRRAATGAVAQPLSQNGSGTEGAGSTSIKRKPRSGKIKVEAERAKLLYVPERLSVPFAQTDLESLFRLLFLVNPLRPSRLLQKLLQNLCLNATYRSVLSTVLVKLLHGDSCGTREALKSIKNNYEEGDCWRRKMDSYFAVDDAFPPSTMFGASTDIRNADNIFFSMPSSRLRSKDGPDGGNTDSGIRNKQSMLPPLVMSRLIETYLNLCKSSPRFCLHTLVSPLQGEDTNEKMSTCFDSLLELLENPMYGKSAAHLDQLLTVIESAVSPLSHISKHADDETEASQREIDAATASSKELVDVPRISVSQSRLQLLCSTLRMEVCRDTAFTKVNTIVRRLCRIESNRGYVLAELASVAHALGGDALRDLKALRVRMDSVTSHLRIVSGEGEVADISKLSSSVIVTMSSTVTVSTSTSEVKLLRVLQTLHALCTDGSDDPNNKLNEGSVVVTEEFVHLLRQMQFDDLWDELFSCLKVVQILEGIKSSDKSEDDEGSDDVYNNDEASGEEVDTKGKKLRNHAAGLLNRFLPTIEAFFIANASAARGSDALKDADASLHTNEEISLDNLVDGRRLMEFISSNKILLNGLVRHKPALLERGLRALVQVSRCRTFLDFDVKRQWFKAQMRRLRQQAARRSSSLRLVIRRNYVFEDTYHYLRVRNADEMRGRLHITFRNEEGVDAGGLSREFFGILAKEIFNPNYALFTSTEDGCTFQPNPNSSINPDHLSYFRFVGRIVGKAVADGFLLDAHFTRSLYKHMLGVEPTHHDMEAIDPDYYRNLITILEYNLGDIGLDLTFSIQDNSFGRSQVIDLVPNGRNIPVVEENKEEYVRKVCQHRMTTSIQSQIKAYLDGFYELVSPDLISVFTPRELELLISGLPDIDLDDLKENTDYVGWKATDKEIEWFWSCLFSLSRNEKAAFLQFVTGSSKVPLAGFGELQGMRGIQKFTVHKASGSKGALMSAHTCFNSLDLPVYASETEMREKLLYAINEGGGAFLFA